MFMLKIIYNKKNLSASIGTASFKMNGAKSNENSSKIIIIVKHLGLRWTRDKEKEKKMMRRHRYISLGSGKVTSRSGQPIGQIAFHII